MNIKLNLINENYKCTHTNIQYTRKWRLLRIYSFVVCVPLADVCYKEDTDLALKGSELKTKPRKSTEALENNHDVKD